MCPTNQEAVSNTHVLDLKGPIHSQLALGGSTVPGVYVLVPRVKSFQEQHSGVKVTLHIGDTLKIIDLVSHGRIEFGIVGSRQDHKRLHFAEYMEDELVLAIPPDHAWKNRREVSVDELVTQPFVLREAGSGTRKVIDDLFRTRGVTIENDMRIVCELGNGEAIKQAILAGIGVSILSRLALENELRFGLLNLVRIKDLHLRRKFYIVSNVHRIKSPLCIEFLRMLGSVETV